MILSLLNDRAAPDSLPDFLARAASGAHSAEVHSAPSSGNSA